MPLKNAHTGLVALISHPESGETLEKSAGLSNKAEQL